MLASVDDLPLRADPVQWRIYGDTRELLVRFPEAERNAVAEQIAGP